MFYSKAKSAVEYILTNGNSWQRWRAMRLCAKEKGSELPPGLTPPQNEDGGVCRPYGESRVSCVGATSGLMLVLTFLGLHHSLEGRNALAYLWQHQQTDGRWTENPAPDSVPSPPWFTPEDIRVDLWETANTAASLSAIGFESDTRVKKSIDWAIRHGRRDGGFPGFIHTTYGMAAAQYRLGEKQKADRHLHYALAFLQKDPDIHDLNWGLMLFYVGGIVKEHPTVSSYLKRVLDLQGADGLWPTQYTGSEAAFALEALELIQAYEV